MDNSTDPSRLVADTTGSDFTPAIYDIAPEDRERAEQLLQFDPLAAPSPVKLTGGGAFKAPERFSLSILPPDKQAPIVAELANVPADMRAQREHELVTNALKQNSTELRIKAGPGAGATELDRAQFQLAKDIHELETEELSIHAQLAEVSKWVPVFNEVTGEPVIDPATGKQQILAIEAIQGDRREAMQNRANELAYRVELLKGIEGDRRIEKALKGTIETEKLQKQQIADREEVKRLADELAREKRLREQAEALAKHKGTQL
ncbi:hypothetical protein [Tsuneonella mangrovi]|uniref:hypothetical protein n=1 Tax=Tsuneonella mangrovi TaxID=1982042 RepID=UPI000BA1EBFE|nr:hypothetical protein [Tsuneonella mangrovi]